VFDNLVESKPKKKPLSQRLPSAMSSFVLHAVLIYSAVQATLGAGQHETEQKLDTTMVFIKEEEQKKEEPPPPELEAPTQSFVSLTAPVSIPTNIPPINLNEKFDPSAFTGIGVEKVLQTTAEVKIDQGQAFVEAAVDEKPSHLSAPPLDYPDLLRQAGIEGQVTLEFIIDTTGHAEPATVRVLNSTNKAFEQSAREMILKSLFRPGRVRGQAVRVLVQQAVAFNIRR
jgi:protein TonB